ncbi:MAG TPA: DNA polymerase/3'-5' exonuclease PolX [Candidatus Hydrogenedentes bacterium]|nr:DNA polymerase/3'-5' exonuclease PolX [Candidatus Hydrogenedentota bacterium]HIJ74068.1 DNA polymerase/3'-5' exonuclease PolX [Candidatus Hydrogenedentota bacterium]
MTKKEVAGVLEEIAVLLELVGENPFKARSYANVARTIQQSEEDIATLVNEKRLRELKGVGETLEQKIAEFVTTGNMKYHQDLRARFPESLFELFRIPGLGAKRIKALYEELGVSSLGELEYACSENRLVTLKGFGPKMQQKALDGIAFAKKHRDLHLFNVASKEARALYDLLSRHKSVIRVEIAGSIRRRKELVKDIDILASGADPNALMEAFVGAENVESVTARGETKSSVVLASGIAADLRVVSDEQFPYALHHFTGSKEHNVAMRQRAKDRGLKMNEYGLFRGDANIPCKDEAAIFAALELPYIPPELREDMGELEAAALPQLVEQNDLLGVFHCHSNCSDGAATIAEMAKATAARGYTYLGVADHSQSAAYAGGLKPDEVERQFAEIHALNAKLDGFRILKGIESDIRSDGSLDYDADLLERFDLVIASIHSKLNMTEQEATKRVVKAIENPHTTILGHPTGRLLLSREGYSLDFEKVFDACAANGVAVEINANCYRLDLDWRHVKRAKEKGLKLCIGPDAHSPDAIDDMAYGLGIARKGWLEAADLLNCMTAAEFLAWRNSS